MNEKRAWPARSWVRVIDGRYFVTWVHFADDGSVESGGDRPLTRRERFMWWLSKRVPKP